MTKHSKNNTASSIFSYAEYKRLDYGTKRPVMKVIFSARSVFTLIFKQDIQKQKTKLEALKREAEDEKARAKEAARERVLRDFEKGQLGLAGTPTAAGTKSAGDLHEVRGTKRKFAFDSSTVENLAREAEEAALREIEREQAEALRHKLPDFWLPSLTPTYTSSGPPQSLTDVKVQTTCRGGNPPHPIALKNLIPVKFTYHNTSSSPSRSSDSTPVDTDEKPRKEKEEPEPMCPSCKKRLSNSILIKQCVVCDKQLKEKDIVELKREGKPMMSFSCGPFNPSYIGTGFAGGGLAETSKAGIAFQG
ncbi:hypothetical protein DXG03_008303 [Asterophora parasitica]|uniref:Uncharacterized protein n=1 Tax=Asterophora parasitica TaxID=117018 RepID=A0A9P7KE46_9AGAR|nr:hypothetical protein DXG03_008303 [Asterophora parasitica]